MKVEIVVYPGFDELDALAPLEVLRNAAIGGADVEVALVATGGGREVEGAHGVRVALDGHYSGGAGLVMVPGGGWNARSAGGARAEVVRGDLPTALRRAHREGTVVAGVCTGVMILAAAGLTRGRHAVTHHSALDDLRASGAEVVPDARVVDDGDVVTCGGVTSGIDLALWLVERYWGAPLADEVGKQMEYVRAPALVTSPLVQPGRDEAGSPGA